MGATTITVRLIILLTVLFLLDFYLFQGLKTAVSKVHSGKLKQSLYLFYWVLNVSLWIGLVYQFLNFSAFSGPRPGLSAFIGIFILFTVPKLIILPVLLGEDIVRLFQFLFEYIFSLFSKKKSEEVIIAINNRRTFLSQLGFALASIPFFSILFGITKGKYNYKIHKVNLEFENLPDEFDGFRITQLSDIHCGSFDNLEEVKRGIDLVNQQNSDVILFTGDLVNNKAEEMERFIQIFKMLKSATGNYSILGNHDYGDYINWPSLDSKNNNLERLKQIHSEIGFRLLLNENIQLRKGNSSIALVGVENWGSPPFPQYGDLKKASAGVENNPFKILLSHDPSHWDKQVSMHPIHYDLTLSGHTHGMQFGIEIPGIKWSPVKYRYPHWAGLYQDGKKYLYVNRGFGFIGFPGRVGIWPEITVITLKKKTA